MGKAMSTTYAKIAKIVAAYYNADGLTDTMNELEREGHHPL